MWLSLNNAFLSIVKDADREGHLLVRARVRKHLQRVFPGAPILTLKDRDYRFRVSVPREMVARMLVEKVEDLEYTNFKDSVKDEDLSRMYHLWWSDHRRLQDRDPFEASVEPKKKYWG